MTGMTIDSSYHSAVPAASCAPRGESIMFGNVLVGVDGTSAGRDAIAFGDVLRDRDGRLTLAHVSVSNSATHLSFDTAAREESLDMLERERAEAGADVDVRDVTSVSVARGLRQLAEISAADLLVVGSCSRGALGRWFLGDDTRASLSGASCAVAVAPGGYAERPGPISTIGVAYNGTPESETALAVARGLAARSGASVRALLVVRPAPGGAGYWEAFDADPGAGVAEVMQAASDRLRLLDDVDGRIAVGVPSEALAAFGAEVDLLVVGSRSHGPVRRTLLGSTSLQLARAARCPLLVLPRAPSVHHEQSLAGPPPADLTAANNGQMRANSAGPIGRHVRDLKASHATGDAIPPASHALMVTAAISGSPLARGPRIHQPEKRRWRDRATRNDSGSCAAACLERANSAAGGAAWELRSVVGARVAHAAIATGALASSRPTTWPSLSK